MEAACRQFCEQLNVGEHRETRRRPVDALAKEQQRLHPLPTEPFTIAFGEVRPVSWDSVQGV